MAEERISEPEGVKTENSKTEKQNEKILGEKNQKRISENCEHLQNV